MKPLVSSNTLSNSDYIASDEKIIVNYELGKMWKELVQ
jgi:hypothetical protein